MMKSSTSKSVYKWQRQYSHAKQRRRFSIKKVINFIISSVKIALSTLAFLAIFAVPYLMHVYIQNNNPIKFQNITIYGNVDNIPQYKLQELIKIASNKNALTFDLDNYRKQWLTEPWVNYVKLERQWPNRLAIYIDVRKPFARWGFAKMIDTDGNIFTPKIIPDGDWLFLHGKEQYAKTLIKKISPTQDLLEALDLRIISLNLDERRAFSIILDNNIQLLLGSENYEQRLQTFSLHYKEYIAARADEIKSVDLRYNSGFAVKWRTKAVSGAYNLTASRH
ncbi:hypothetical protein AwWohl_05890 [Gammaproteobacteria bacterium]|nr:hypothetical protein AwWohl_05890 [Gammaproteobacteria bacterium]